MLLALHTVLFIETKIMIFFYDWLLSKYIAYCMFVSVVYTIKPNQIREMRVLFAILFFLKESAAVDTNF